MNLGWCAHSINTCCFSEAFLCLHSVYHTFWHQKTEKRIKITQQWLCNEILLKAMLTHFLISLKKKSKKNNIFCIFSLCLLSIARNERKNYLSHPITDHKRNKNKKISSFCTKDCHYCLSTKKRNHIWMTSVWKVKNIIFI